MPRNGSGVYSLVTSPFATSGAIAVASTVNANINDIGNEITASLPRAGTAAMTGNLAMGSNKITGLAAGTTNGDAVRYEQVPLLAGTNTYTADQTIQSSDAGAAEGPLLTLDRNSASPADNDILGGVKFSGRDDGGGTDVYARILAVLLDNQASGEDGELKLGTVVAGTLADRMIVGQGVRIGSATGGDQGAGTLNATNVYDDGVSISPFGQHTIWVPATAMTSRTTNGAASGSVETGTNDVMLVTKDFDATTSEGVQFAVQMPKSWDEGTIVAQFVWKHAATATNFGVRWGVRAVAFADDDAGDAAFGTEQEVTDTGGTTNDIYISPETSAMTVAGSPGAEEWVVFEVYRDPADAADTMTIDAGLLGVKIHYTTNAATDD
jgi:hypothetical protein